MTEDPYEDESSQVIEDKSSTTTAAEKSLVLDETPGLL